MSAIDMHAHAFPDSLAPRAIAALEAECPWKAVADGTVGSLLKSMDAADIDVSVLCTIATKPDQVEGIVGWCRKVRSDRIDVLPSVHPKTPDAAGWIRRFADEGFAGIKLHPMYQDFALDDPSMDDVYAAAAQCRLLITAHCGRDIAFPPDDDRASPERIVRVIDRHPDLTLVCTHLGGWRMWDEVEKLLLGREVYLETSFSLDELDPARAAEMILTHGEDRVMFGTDWPWQRQEESLALLRKLPLTDAQRRKVLWSNAANLLGY
ncbi:MAG TPA: amidohydrolase family protein [Phycisphaerae bacterium]|nr:amidohydrolase family protein [Phycisphaerae bacterium]